MTNIVSFKSVQKTYDGETLVVKNLNLDIKRGEFLTMLGPSGSGKTTCLMMLAGFETATHGEILLENRPINRIPPEKRNIGMVFQSYALFPHMSIAENLAFPLKLRKVSKSDIDSKVKRALAMVNMDRFASRMPGQLSGGQQQRIAVARALVFEPSIVLMDEPLGALDKQLREQLQFEIKRIHEESGLTVVYVTHDQSEAMTMSDRIAVFNNGVIQQLATPAKLYDSPENAFVANFIGENNDITGVVRRIESGNCIVDLDGHGQIHTGNFSSVSTNEKVSISVRPEKVLIGSDMGSVSNRFTAKVTDLIYYGDHTRVIMNACGKDGFVAKIANNGNPINFGIGSSIEVGWSVDGCCALK
ncbi:ABC transporter ATP-binding protein [Leeia sp. TBRC 13508]|uniref:Spermidine/putrescine import ATP-binding protein PotA n=2 Tax=Leeia speluncae TaxID=2884804 RepID=A0ABS8D9W6_9NEIS|nr:ABC transporter ATP-binding protein [Leeia speluncae]MCB6184969.1 ABC transporter ATP-binding protein [Leeia speluncae]